MFVWLFMGAVELMDCWICGLVACEGTGTDVSMFVWLFILFVLFVCFCFCIYGRESKTGTRTFLGWYPEIF